MQYYKWEAADRVGVSDFVRFEARKGIRSWPLFNVDVFVRVGGTLWMRIKPFRFSHAKLFLWQ